MGFQPGTGLLKGKGDKESRLQGEHLQKAKLTRQVLLCAIAKQLRQKMRCYTGLFPCLLITNDSSSSLYRIFTKNQDRKWRALVKNGTFALENY